MIKFVSLPESQYPTVHYLSTSNYSDFVPLYALLDGITITTVGGRFLYYEFALPDLDNLRRYHIKRFTRASIDIMIGRQSWYQLSYKGITRVYLVHNGMVIYMEDNIKPIPLLMLAARSSQIYNINRRLPDPSQFTLLIDRKFIADKEHLKVYRSIKKYYIDVVEQQIDTLYSNDISTLCFNNPISPLPRFKDLEQVLQYYKGMNTILSKELQT